MKVEITKELYSKWKKNKDVNPITGRKLNKDSLTGIYNEFVKFGENIKPRINKINKLKDTNKTGGFPELTPFEDAISNHSARSGTLPTDIDTKKDEFLKLYPTKYPMSKIYGLNAFSNALLIDDLKMADWLYENFEHFRTEMPMANKLYFDKNLYVHLLKTSNPNVETLKYILKKFPNIKEENDILLQGDLNLYEKSFIRGGYYNSNIEFLEFLYETYDVKNTIPKSYNKKLNVLEYLFANDYISLSYSNIITFLLTKYETIKEDIKSEYDNINPLELCILKLDMLKYKQLYKVYKTNNLKINIDLFNMPSTQDESFKETIERFTQYMNDNDIENNTVKRFIINCFIKAAYNRYKGLLFLINNQIHTEQPVHIPKLSYPPNISQSSSVLLNQIVSKRNLTSLDEIDKIKNFELIQKLDNNLIAQLIYSLIKKSILNEIDRNMVENSFTYLISPDIPLQGGKKYKRNKTFNKSISDVKK